VEALPKGAVEATVSTSILIKPQNNILSGSSYQLYLPGLTSAFITLTVGKNESFEPTKG
jgi:hypothetical protein